MKLRILFLILVLFNTSLMATAYESETFFDISVRRATPLSTTNLKKAISGFKAICKSQSYRLPTGYTLKNSDLFFDLERTL